MNSTVLALGFALLIPMSAECKEISAIVFGKKELTLKAKAQGEMMQVKFDEGDWVKAQTLIAQLDNRRAKIDLDAAQVELRIAQSDYESSKKLGRFISRDDLAVKEGAYLKKKSAVASKELDLVNTQILAPIDGIITKKYLEVGETVSVGEKMFDLVQLDELILMANVPANEIEKFKKSSSVNVRLIELKGKTFKATVFFVSPVIDGASDTVKVKLTLRNESKSGGKDYILKPGMIALIDL